MVEHPIIFSGPMVPAILDGRKTQTRRVIRADRRNGYPLNWRPLADPHSGSLVYCNGAAWDRGVWMFRQRYPQSGGPLATCPYCQPGDRLWVRETFGRNVYGGTVYKGDPGQETVRKTIPSIHMPRWASRILLEIVSVRVQRVQEISEDDAKAEGCIWRPVAGRCTEASNIAVFRTVWDSINGKRKGCSWESNPWVWAITFMMTLLGRAYDWIPYIQDAPEDKFNDGVARIKQILDGCRLYIVRAAKKRRL